MTLCYRVYAAGSVTLLAVLLINEFCSLKQDVQEEGLSASILWGGLLLELGGSSIGAVVITSNCMILSIYGLKCLILFFAPAFIRDLEWWEV